MLCLFVSTAIFSQQKPVIPDTALAGVIIRDVLNKEREKIPTVISRDMTSKSEEAILTGWSPRLQQMIREIFNVTDKSTLRVVLHNRYVLDTLMKNVPGNIKLKGSVVDGKYPNEQFRYSSSLIMDIYILYHPGGNNCIVSYFLFGQESNVVLLEKKNGNWKVMKKLLEHIL